MQESLYFIALRSEESLLPRGGKLSLIGLNFCSEGTLLLPLNTIQYRLNRFVCSAVVKPISSLLTQFYLFYEGISKHLMQLELHIDVPSHYEMLNAHYNRNGTPLINLGDQQLNSYAAFIHSLYCRTESFNMLYKNISGRLVKL